MTQAFPLAHVLSIIGSKPLTEDIDDIYKLLNFMTGEDLYTHQLIRARQEVVPHVLRQNPQLSGYDDTNVTPTNWRETLAGMEARYGKFIPLTSIPDYKPLDPITEAERMFGEGNIIIINHR